MNEKTNKIMWATVNILLVALIIIGCLWYVPYEISHDQHMVDTVNERAFQYNGTGTLTDFTDAEIMSNDADLNYEQRTWKLQHEELYYLSALEMATLYAVLISVVCFMIFGYVIPEILGYNDDEEDDDYDEDFDFPEEPRNQTTEEKDATTESETE